MQALFWTIVVVLLILSVVVYWLGAFLGRCADEAQDPSNW